MNKKILYFIYETFSVVYLFFYYSIVYTIYNMSPTYKLNKN